MSTSNRCRALSAVIFLRHDCDNIKYFDRPITLLPEAYRAVSFMTSIKSLLFFIVFINFFIFLQLGAVHKRTRVIQIVWRLAIHTFACVSQIFLGPKNVFVSYLF